MNIYHSIVPLKHTQRSLILTIGNFDGVHLAHQYLIQTIKKFGDHPNEIVVLTFKNHPSSILKPDSPTPFICTTEHKILLLNQLQVDHLYLIDFTQELANYEAHEFIQLIRKSIPFTHLILGYDAHLGKGRGGTQAVMADYAKQNNFHLEYLPVYRYGEQIVSSTTIRKFIQEGQLTQASELLGRPYSIYGKVVSGSGKGRELGFPTANIDVSGLCLPPIGVYDVKIKVGDSFSQGIANLGVAPTIKNSKTPTLEVHLLSGDKNLYGEYVEVIFNKFIRPERKFASLEDLKYQISLDIKSLLDTL